MNDLFEIEMVKDTSLQAGRLLVAVLIIDQDDEGSHCNSNCSNNAADDMP